MKITGHSKLEFFRLRSISRPDEHNLYPLIRWDTDDTLKVDKNVILLVKHLTDGKTVQEAAQEIKFSLDMVLLLVNMLRESHFIKSINGELIEDTANKINPWFTNIDRKWFRWITFKPVYYFITGTIVIGISLGLFFFGIPSYKDFFWNPDIFIVFVSFFIADFVLMFFHELAHFVATKAVGGEAEMRMNYRYIYVVAETDSYHLAAATKRQRYLVYLAGSILDLFIAGLLYWFLLITTALNINIGLLYDFLIALILLQFIGIIWEFNVFLETDMYNFISEYLNMENLRSDALKYITLHTKKWKQTLLFPIKKLLLFFSKNQLDTSDDLRLLGKWEKRKLYIYIFVLITGILFTTFEYFFYSIPLDLTFISEGIQDASRSVKEADVVLFVKSMILLALVCFDYFLLLFLRLRVRR